MSEYWTNGFRSVNGDEEYVVLFNRRRPTLISKKICVKRQQRWSVISVRKQTQNLEVEAELSDCTLIRIGLTITFGADQDRSYAGMNSKKGKFPAVTMGAFEPSSASCSDEVKVSPDPLVRYTNFLVSGSKINDDFINDLFEDSGRIFLYRQQDEYVRKHVLDTSERVVQTVYKTMDLNTALNYGTNLATNLGKAINQELKAVGILTENVVMTSFMIEDDTALSYIWDEETA